MSVLKCTMMNMDRDALGENDFGDLILRLDEIYTRGHVSIYVNVDHAPLAQSHRSRPRYTYILPVRPIRACQDHESRPELSRLPLSPPPNLTRASIRIPFGRRSSVYDRSRHRQRLKTHASAETLRDHATKQTRIFIAAVRTSSARLPR